MRASHEKVASDFYLMQTSHCGISMQKGRKSPPFETGVRRVLSDTGVIARRGTITCANANETRALRII
ncbi:unnamed protein product, partial [Iphiclides podalirius]